MAENLQVSGMTGTESEMGSRPGDPCIMVIFGASGDLTKRLLMPALYNLACDGLLPENFALVGSAMDPLTSEQFREKMSTDIKEFNTRKTLDTAVWDKLANRLHYTPGKFDDLAAFQKLAEIVKNLDAQHKAGGNVLFYMATPPWAFGLISGNLEKTGFKSAEGGWRRIIVEKPFGTSLDEAIKLNREILGYWNEDQIFRIDHYLGKETVQNLLAFRFSNGIFEPLWNKSFIEHIQFTVSESVAVEGRAGYYDGSGVLRDMIQNHMFQMLAYLCMEPPISFSADSVRDEKSKVLKAVRVMKPEEVPIYSVRGQYGAGKKPDGKPVIGYREDPEIKAKNPQSRTETFAAVRLHIDNWRWEGVPIYLRSGKALWKRGTDIVVQFKKAPEVIFRDTPVDHLESNRLVFHIQPDQGIELRFHAKIPGPAMRLQKVNMRFSYGEAFQASRGTGYEALIHNCMIGDATLFSRTDLVEQAWRIAQPMIDLWAKTDPPDFPNYQAGSWGPKAAFDLIEKDGHKWEEVVNRDVLEAVRNLENISLFEGCDPIFLNSVAMALKPVVHSPGDLIIRKGDTGKEMYLICRGEVEVLDAAGKVVATLSEGNVFGEMALLMAQPRSASIRSKTLCDLFMLSKADFAKVLREQPRFMQSIQQIAKERYKVNVGAENLLESAAQ